MIRPRSAACSSAAAIGAGCDQDELVEVRQGRVDLAPVDRPRVVRAFGDAARDQLGDGRRVAAQRVDQRVEPDRERDGRTGRRGAARPPPPIRTTTSRSTVAASPRPTVRSRPARGLAAGARAPPRSACRVISPNATSAWSSPPARRSSSPRGPSKVGVVPDGDDEDIRGHIPRLVGDDAELARVSGPPEVRGRASCDARSTRLGCGRSV